MVRGKALFLGVTGIIFLTLMQGWSDAYTFFNKFCWPPQYGQNHGHVRLPSCLGECHYRGVPGMPMEMRLPNMQRRASCAIQLWDDKHRRCPDLMARLPHGHTHAVQLYKLTSHGLLGLLCIIKLYFGSLIKEVITLSIRYSWSLMPYALRWMTRILLFKPSMNPSETL